MLHIKDKYFKKITFKVWIKYLSHKSMDFTECPWADAYSLCGKKTKV
jgi:hypothetical protein